MRRGDFSSLFASYSSRFCSGLDKGLVYFEFLLFFTEFVSNCVSKARNPTVTPHFCKEFLALPKMMARLNQTTKQ